MKKQTAIIWMNKLAAAWKNHSIPDVIRLFDCVEAYYEGPFSSPVSSKEDVKMLWEEIMFQSIESLDIDLIAYERGKCAMHWYLKYTDIRDGSVAEMDGTYEVHFDDSGNCIFFKQWWVFVY